VHPAHIVNEFALRTDRTSILQEIKWKVFLQKILETIALSMGRQKYSSSKENVNFSSKLRFNHQMATSHLLLHLVIVLVGFP